jgi:hypothetical protein
MTPKNVTLQLYLEGKIDALVERMCAWEKAHSEKHELEKEILATAKESADMALNLQAAEVLRRLALLNGEAAKLDEMQRTYLPREMWLAANADLRRALELNAAEVLSKADTIAGDLEKTKLSLGTFLPREVHEALARELDRRINTRVSNEEFTVYKSQTKEKVDKLDGSVDKLRLTEANLRGQVIAYAASISTAIGIVTFILSKIIQ